MRNDFEFDLESFNNIPTEKALFLERKDRTYILGLGLTSRCNLQCPKCYYASNSLNKKRDLDIFLLKEILNVNPLFKSVNLALEGEPFCHPQIFESLNCISEKTESISISTNSLVLTKEKILNLKNYNFDIFNLSIDTASYKNYSIFHRGGSLQKFIKNATLISDTLENKVTITTVLYNENFEDVNEIPKLANFIGVNRINLMLLRPHPHATENGITIINTKRLVSSLKKIIANAEKYKVKLLFDSYFGNSEAMNTLISSGSKYVIIDNKPIVECLYPWFSTSILSDGSIFPCRGDFKPRKMNSFTFDEIFNHNYLLKLRYSILNNRLTIACKKCHYKLKEL